MEFNDEGFTDEILFEKQVEDYGVKMMLVITLRKWENGECDIIIERTIIKLTPATAELWAQAIVEDARDIN